MDYLNEALASSRRIFVQVHNFPFLVTDGPIERPEKPGKTATFDPLASTLPGSHTDRERRGPLMLFAVRKVIVTFAHMITVGRTANNDVVLADVSVSKFHARFQRTGDRLELGDAGSKNGTAVNGESLVPRGALQAIKTGDRIRFGRVDVMFLDAGGAWDVVDRRR